MGKKQRALDALYDVIKSKKHRTWQKIHEQIMAKYLELCVDLRKSHIAKEGLYQYKIICQQVNIIIFLKIYSLMYIFIFFFSLNFRTFFSIWLWPFIHCFEFFLAFLLVQFNFCYGFYK